MLRKRSISKYEVETLFRDVLNMNQIQKISNLIKLLGVYIFLERGQLDYFAKEIFGEKIGLSFIKKAISYNLVSELHSDLDIEGKFYFQLKNDGFYFLDTLKFQYTKLNLDAGAKEREEILSINNYLIENNYLINNSHYSGINGPIFTKDNIILFKDMKETKLAELVRQNILGENFTIEDVYEKFEFKKMELHKVNLDIKTRGSQESLLTK